MQRGTRLLAAASIAAALLAIAAPAAAQSGPEKVVQGAFAPSGAYPAQVGLLLPDVADNFQAQYCSGTLIHPQWVLTAAHCVEGEPSPDVLLGTARLDGSGTRVRTTTYALHAGFQFPTDDIALVRLDSPAPGPVAPLALAGMDDLEEPGTLATVSGWGSIRDVDEVYPVELMDAQVPVLDDADCDLALRGHGYGLPADSGLVCAGNGRFGTAEQPDACRGDSGGPLWATGADGVRRQIGIVSGGVECGFSPSMYTSVVEQIGWIEVATGLQFSSFTDITTNGHEANIERVALHGFTGGIGGGLFGPEQAVTRGQMATFLARAMQLEAPPVTPFSDVAGTVHAPGIAALAAAGVAGGFADGTYRPNDVVTRGQMATFVARAVGLQPGPVAPFVDVAGTAHQAGVDAVAAAGIAGGYPDGTYRPADGVTRGQMATFLARAFLD